MSNFYISDLHIGCYNKYEKRTPEIDEILKKNWNNTVTNADTVYILGDVGRAGTTKDNEYLISILANLKGRKVLIKGNHDDLRDYRIKQLFTEICDYKEVIDQVEKEPLKVVLSHYPILFWNGQHKGNIHLYGHVHNSSEEAVYQTCLDRVNDYFRTCSQLGRDDCPPARAYNVGAMKEYMGYCPRTLEEITKEDFAF